MHQLSRSKCVRATRESAHKYMAFDMSKVKKGLKNFNMKTPYEMFEVFNCAVEKKEIHQLSRSKCVRATRESAHKYMAFDMSKVKKGLKNFNMKTPYEMFEVFL